MSNTNPVLLTGGPAGQSVYAVSTVQNHQIGARATLQDGREFEYCKSVSSTAIGKGKLATYDTILAAVDKIAVQAAANIGSTTIAVTVTTTAAANAYAGGYISIDDDAGEAELYGIVSHAAHTSGTLVLTLDRGLVVAVTTNTTATLVFNSAQVKLSAAVTAGAQPVEVAAGVPLVNVPAGDTTNQYFWVQKRGLANVLFGTAVGAIGQPVYHGEDVGSFQAAVQTTAEAGRIMLGTVVALLPVDTEYHLVRLNIA